MTCTNGKSRIVATYDYVDERGTLLYQSVRYEPKDFKQRRPRVPNPRSSVKGDWHWSLGDMRRVLYNLPALIAAPIDRPVFVCEGEKDVNNLADIGVLATTNAMGAGKWRDEYTEQLRDRHVFILPDNDEVGRQHAENVARCLVGVARGVCIVELPNLLPKGDVSDWINNGGTKEILLELAAESQEYRPPAAPTRAPTGGKKEVPPSSKANAVQLSTVEPEEVDWLWENHVARKTVTIIDGDPGNGKSTITCDLAARVTRGWHMPPEGGPDAEGIAGAVLILSAEDHLANTIRPRLDAAGADVTKVFALESITVGKEERPPVLPFDLDAIEELIEEKGIVLMIVDPFLAYLDAEIDSHRDQDVRRALARLKKLAEKTNVAIVLIRHFNKFAGAKAMYRGGGSIGITGAARCALVVGRDPDNQDRLVLAGVKNNLGPLPASLAYRLTPAGSVALIEWEPKPCDLTAEDITAQPARNSPVQDAAASWLREQLAAHPVAARDLYAAAEEAGHSKRTIDRAKKSLGVVTYREGYGKDGVWMWQLPKGCQPSPIRGNVATYEGKPKGCQIATVQDDVATFDPEAEAERQAIEDEGFMGHTP